MEGTPTGGADRPSAARSTEAAQESPPTPTPEQPAPMGGGGLAESRDWLSGQGLIRPRQGRMIAGVCAGLARRWVMPVFLVPVLMVAAGFAGVGVVGYLALWVLMPNEG
jgi:phage shock protein PspC (stress-responsive transcriptional regulator)